MRKYKYALFDWDGCLADTLSNAKRIHIKLAQKNNVFLNLDELRSVFGNWEKAAQVSLYNSVDVFKKDYNEEVIKSILEVKLNCC